MKRLSLRLQCVCENENQVIFAKPGLLSPTRSTMKCTSCGTTTLIKFTQGRKENKGKVELQVLQVFASDLLKEALELATAEKAEALKEAAENVPEHAASTETEIL